MTLLTLLARPDSDEALLRRTLFGADAAAALCAEGAVSLLALGGAYLTADALSAQPPRTRAAVRTAQRLQLLAATGAAITARAGTAFATLVPAASRLRPALAAPLQALNAHVARAYAAAASGGAASAGRAPRATRELLNARTQQAEGLEAAGRFLEAAALYRQNLADDARSPGAHLLHSPPMEHAYLGLALKRAGRLEEASAAYAAGLRAAAEGPLLPDTPAARESLRLHLRNLEITLRLAQRDAEGAKRAVLELFRNEAAAARAGGARAEPLWDFDAHSVGGAGFLLERPSGRGWELCAEVQMGGGGMMQVFRTREVAPAAVARRNLAALEQMRVRTGAAENAGYAAKELKASLARQAGRERAVPKLPPALCARCGGAADKLCSACGGAAYCGAECQKAHWKEHKAACKAARQQQAAQADAAGA